MKCGPGCTSATKTTALKKCNSCCFEDAGVKTEAQGGEQQVSRSERQSDPVFIQRFPSMFCQHKIRHSLGNNSHWALVRSHPGQRGKYPTCNTLFEICYSPPALSALQTSHAACVSPNHSLLHVWHLASSFIFFKGLQTQGMKAAFSLPPPF